MHNFVQAHLSILYCESKYFCYTVSLIMQTLDCYCGLVYRHMCDQLLVIMSGVVPNDAIVLLDDLSAARAMLHSKHLDEEIF